MDGDPDITRLLREQKQRPEAADELYRAVYERLRAMARGRLRGGAPGQTLGATALVHEAYVRLVDATATDWNDRNHFFAVAATAMRQIVVDQARRKVSQKRGGDQHLVALDDERVGVARSLVDVIDVDDALRRLEQVDERAPPPDTLVVERDEALVPATLVRNLAARLVHDDLPHRRRRHGEEVVAIVPVGCGRVDQAQVGLVDQRRRPQGLSG